MTAIYTHDHQVGSDEVEPEGHANCLAYLQWTRYAAINHSSEQGWPPERYQEQKIGWVVRSHTIRYFQPAYKGDDVAISTWVTEFQKTRSVRRYRISRKSDDATLATAETHWALVDLETRTPTRVPQELSEAFPTLDESQEPQGVR